MNLFSKLPKALLLPHMIAWAVGMLIIYIWHAAAVSDLAMTDEGTNVSEPVMVADDTNTWAASTVCKDWFFPLPEWWSLESDFSFGNGLVWSVTISAPAVWEFKEGNPSWKRNSINYGGGTWSRKTYTISALPWLEEEYSFSVGNLNPEEVQAIKFYNAGVRAYPSFEITGAIAPTYDEETGEFLSDATDKLNQANIRFDLQWLIFDEIVVVAIWSYDYTYNTFNIPASCN